MDRNQLLNDSEQAMRLVLDGRQASIWTAMPCIVKSVDFATMTLEAQPAIQGTVEIETGAFETVNLPLLVDVPIVFPSAGGFALTLPIVAGNEVLVVFASRCIDAWWQNGGIQKPMEARMHDLSDGFAIPALMSQPKKLTGVSSTEIQLRNLLGTTYFSITPGGKLGLANATTDLKTVLTDLESLLNTFMTALAGFSGGGSPVSQTMLQAPAATAVTALAAVLTKIGALLK